MVFHVLDFLPCVALLNSSIVHSKRLHSDAHLSLLCRMHSATQKAFMKSFSSFLLCYQERPLAGQDDHELCSSVV